MDLPRYRRGSSITAQDIDALRRWVYTAMAFSHYSNQVEGKLDIEARLIREASGETLWSELLRRASGARPVGAKIEATELASRTYFSSWFSFLYIAALRRHAKDWLRPTGNWLIGGVGCSDGLPIGSGFGRC